MGTVKRSFPGMRAAISTVPCSEASSKVSSCARTSGTIARQFSRTLRTIVTGGVIRACSPMQRKIVGTAVHTGGHRAARLKNRASETDMQDPEHLRLVVEAAPIAIVVADPDGRITLVNEQSQRLFGYGRGELLGHSI